MTLRLAISGQGHPVPRPGNTRRLWGVVPVVSPWVLRLFRGLPTMPPNTAALIPVLSRDGMSANGVDRVFSNFNVTRFIPERNDKMNPEIRTLSVGALTRVEGEGALHVTLSDGAVESVELNIYEPPRFFEAFLRGRGVYRAAGHYRAGVRHLPSRLSGERVQTRSKMPAA